MSTITDNDLKEVKDMILQLNERMNQRFDRVDQRFDKVNQEITELKIGQAEIATRLNDWKPSIDKTADLFERVGELKNWKQIAIVLLTGFVTSLFWNFKDKM
ncbi:MAG: hypothetical protein IGQ45_07990 [Cyanobacterium sp. T60_A2020_053]|nr:hypothetical protein [Cyanobacterium sp. T60_A2020_053]